MTLNLLKSLVWHRSILFKNWRDHIRHCQMCICTWQAFCKAEWVWSEQYTTSFPRASFPVILKTLSRAARSTTRTASLAVPCITPPPCPAWEMARHDQILHTICSDKLSIKQRKDSGYIDKYDIAHPLSQLLASTIDN